MTNNIAIKVENLGKHYHMGQCVGSGAQYKTLRESSTNAIYSPFRNPQFDLSSFSVLIEGAVGIIRNGA